MAPSKKSTRKERDTKAGSKTPKSSQESQEDENGVFMTETLKDLQDSGPMSVVKQATLINYHLAIEDSVDIDKIWDVMQPIFNDDEQEDIQTQGHKKAEMKRLLDLLPNKNDHAFDKLVNALRPEYKWLALRLQQGVKDEEQRVNKLGKGIKRKIALALLTARISDRQKDGILDRVTSVVEAEMTKKANRVNIPDHRAAAQLDMEHRTLQDLIRNEVDPLLYGEEPKSARDEDDYDDVIEALRCKLEELQVFKESYEALNLGKQASSNLPSLLLQKIEEVKTRVKILQQEKREAVEEAARLAYEKEEQQRALSRIEQHNRNLALENRALEEERQWLERSMRKNQDGLTTLERDFQRVDEENRNLKSELQQVLDRVADLTLRNRTLDNRNSKLTRDNFKLSTANNKLRMAARANSYVKVTELRSENKRLTSDMTQLKKDIQRMEVERRQLVIRSHKLEAENRSLREQKRKLLLEKKRTQDENRSLKKEAKRLALGKYSPLPPISERREREAEEGDYTSRDDTSRDDTSHDDVSRRSRSVERRSERRRPVRKVARSADFSPSKPRDKPETPWNKYQAEKTTPLPRGKASTSTERNKEEEEEEEEEVDEDGNKVPGYMKSTTSSKKRHYLEEEGRGRRSAAWK